MSEAKAVTGNDSLYRRWAMRFGPRRTRPLRLPQWAQRVQRWAGSTRTRTTRYSDTLTARTTVTVAERWFAHRTPNPVASTVAANAALAQALPALVTVAHAAPYADPHADPHAGNHRRMRDAPSPMPVGSSW